MNQSPDLFCPQLDRYLPQQVNSGPWLTAFTLNRLRDLPAETKFVLPICSMAEDFSELHAGPELTLPPLFHEAMTAELKAKILDRIVDCFPVYGAGQENRQRVKIVEYPRRPLPPVAAPQVLAFSVDTAVEEHGPHLPLATDTIQSYSVLETLTESLEQLELARPLEYGQLTWGLPFGFSVDLTAELLTEYVTGYLNALSDWYQPKAVYVVDVHGSVTHRQAIVDGLGASRVAHWAFRWLHEPLAEFASARGDQHAGGVETALVERVSENLIDREWFPAREAEITSGQMTLEAAVELTPDLGRFCRYVREEKANGIVGDIANYHTLDADLMFRRMLDLATRDVKCLLRGESSGSTNAGKNLW